MSKDFKKRDTQKILIGIFIMGGLFCAAAWWLYFQFPKGSAPLVLHFRVGSGADLLGARETIRAIPLFASVLLFLNAVLSVMFYRRDSELSLLLGVGTVLLEALLLFALAILFIANHS